jgi:hypothetical protein
MISIALGILWLLIGLCVIVGAYYAVLWVCAQLGVPLPPMAVKIVLIVIGLLFLIYLITLIAGGGGIPLWIGR